MSTAALIVAIVGVVIATWAAVSAKRSATQAKRSADAAERSADAGERSAATSEAALALDTERADEERRLRLEQRAPRLVAMPGGVFALMAPNRLVGHIKNTGDTAALLEAAELQYRGARVEAALPSDPLRIDAGHGASLTFQFGEQYPADLTSESPRIVMTYRAADLDYRAELAQPLRRAGVDVQGRPAWEGGETERRLLV